MDPLDTTRAHVDAFARTIAEVENLSPASVARRLSTLSKFYRYAEGEEPSRATPSLTSDARRSGPRAVRFTGSSANVSGGDPYRLSCSSPHGPHS